jgi:hypothetical protein
MTQSGDRPGPQTIPESAKEGHTVKFSSPGGDKDIGFDALKNSEKGWNLRGIMLTIRIKSNDDLIVFLKNVLEPRPEGCPLPKVRGVLEKKGSVFHGDSFRPVARTVIDHDRIHPQRADLFQNRAQGLLRIISRDEDTNFIELSHKLSCCFQNETNGYICLKKHQITSTKQIPLPACRQAGTTEIEASRPLGVASRR